MSLSGEKGFREQRTHTHTLFLQHLLTHIHTWELIGTTAAFTLLAHEMLQWSRWRLKRPLKSHVNFSGNAGSFLFFKLFHL